MTRKWEYKALRICNGSHLDWAFNDLDKDGWEFFMQRSSKVHETEYIFRRPYQEEDKETCLSETQENDKQKPVSLHGVAAKLVAHCDHEKLIGTSPLEFEVAYGIAEDYYQAEHICRFVLEAAGVKYVEEK